MLMMTWLTTNKVMVNFLNISSFSIAGQPWIDINSLCKLFETDSRSEFSSAFIRNLI